MNNIILIGMPGAGKSTLGVILAKALAYKFIDTDLLIQEKLGCTLRDIIEKHGNECFLDIENETLRTICAERTVIATGGSAVYGKEAMERMHALGTVVYLKVGYDEIEKRVADFRARGIAMGHNRSLRELYDERVVLYEKNADITVCEDKLTAEQTVAEIIKNTGKN